MNYSTLNTVKPGESAVIYSLNVSGSMRRRLLDMGLIKNTAVECVGKSPMGDPSAFLVRGAVVALRSDDCKNIFIYA